MTQVCQQTELRPHEVRYLEHTGHLRPTALTGRQHRRYTAEQIQILKGYRIMRRAGIKSSAAIAIAEAIVVGTARLDRASLKELELTLSEEAVVRLRAATFLGELLAANRYQ